MQVLKVFYKSFFTIYILLVAHSLDRLSPRKNVNTRSLFREHLLLRALWLVGLSHERVVVPPASQFIALQFTGHIVHSIK